VGTLADTLRSLGDEGISIYYNYHKQRVGAAVLFGYKHCSLMRNLRLFRIATVVLVGVYLPVKVKTQETEGWQFDSLSSKSIPEKSDAQVIYELLLHMLDRWNAHDIDGYLACYWNSPELLVVIDSEQFNGWRQLHDSYLNGYPNRASMGFSTPARIQVKLLKSDIALVLTWWSMSFPNSKKKVVGNTTMNLQKFEDGWKIVSTHSSTAEM
jgi:hypothetical protein